MLHWKCINNCGACCRLSPEERLEALRFLDQEQTKKYFSLVDKNGWCVNYNVDSCNCNIYDERPDFCRVSNISNIFNIEQNQVELFAINCCRDQINHIYGKDSAVLKRFETEIRKK